MKHILVIPNSSGKGACVIKCHETVDEKQLLQNLIAIKESNFTPRYFELSPQQLAQPELVIEFYEHRNSGQTLAILNGENMDKEGSPFVKVHSATLTKKKNEDTYYPVSVLRLSQRQLLQNA